MGFIPSENTETMSTVDLTGFVMDPDGNPVSGASIQYKTAEALTDDRGYYTLTAVEASSEHASLKVTKTGFFSGSRTFRTPKAGTVFHRTTLVPQGDPVSFTGGNGSVATNLVSIDFPENSVKDVATGAVYTGDVNVYIKHIGTDELEILHSYGMVFVEMYADDGRKLNVADGMTVNMTYEIPDELLSSAPETIKMWWFDYDAGLWRQEGEAIRDGSRWIGEVSHFSCWNFDLNVPSVLVSGQIAQSNGGVSKFYVSFLNDEGKGGRGSAYTNGYFSGRVEAGVPLESKYTFTNNSSVSLIADLSYTSFWDFGGDGTSTEKSPTHTFSATGIHEITLTITAADGEVATATQTIDVGGDSNKFGRITDLLDYDTGEFRLELEDAILKGRVSFIYRVSEGPGMDIFDAFIALSGTLTTGDLNLVEIRLKDDTFHEFREGASDVTIAAANFPMGVVDEWVPVEISWNADGVTAPTYSITIGGQIVITDAVSTTRNPSDAQMVADHLEATIDGLHNFQWKYNSNSLTSDGRYDIDNIKVFSSDSGTETIVFQDDFEGRINGEDLNPDFNLNSPYHPNSSDATVGEDF